MQISPIDYIMIALYVCTVVGVGIYANRKKSMEIYFANGRQTGLLLLVCTTLSTTVGAGVVLGVASSSFQTGISFGLLMMVITALGWLCMARLAPKIKAFGDKERAYTFSEYLSVHYSKRVGTLGVIVILASYFVITAVQFVAMAQLVSAITPLNFTPALLVVSLLTIAYAAFAGIRGDFYTDALQTVVIVGTLAALLVAGFMTVSPQELLMLPEGYFSPYSHGGPVFFWGGIIFGIPLVITSVDAWQRIYAAKDYRTAQKALYWTGALKVITIITAIILGMLAYHIIPNAPADGIVFSLMKELLPPGLLGIGVAGILAIIMSTVDSGINIGSSVITKGLYLQRFPDSPEHRTLAVAKIAAVAFGLGSFIVACFVRDIVLLTVVSAQILLVFAPALLGGLVWGQRSKAAAFWSILCGFCITLAAIPVNANLAFLPGLITATGVYVVVAGVSRYMTSASATLRYFSGRRLRP